MTKRRSPLSIDMALARIAGHVDGGFVGMAAITGRKERTVRNWGDPDSPEHIPMDFAIALDLAYIAQGGDGAPIFEAYSTILKVQGADRFAQPIALGQMLPDLIREDAEAECAVAVAAQLGAPRSSRTTAAREVEAMIAKWGTMLHLLRNGDPEQQPP